ncbi:hypothetical protein DFH06DRAFT_707581 [Mycena polygramma]|nr:hypothetical protein DFH06DRAFT_107376 [Mycena polygramma]KAJ7629642.1 hypothetical protein DFH06DRAFT_707581 [Mycena polygramma]
MPSFSQITLLATLALAAFTSAAPLAVEKRDLVPLPAIITQLTSQLGPLTSALSSIDASNATTDVVGPITDQIKDALSGAVGQVSALAGSPVSTILSTADGVISATDAAQLLAPVFTTVFSATQQVLNVVGASPVAPLVNDVIGALDPLLSTAAPLVNGLTAALAPILGPVVNTLDGLGLGPVVGLLGSLI